MIRIAAPLLPLACALLAGCATPRLPLSSTHLAEEPRAEGAIPDPVRQSALLPPPKPSAKVETYSVTVHKVPVQSLLFALARDAGMNVDIHPGIEGTVTLNALDQTLQQLLSRIGRQVDMRYEIDGNNLVVLPDSPEWRNYKVDYVNIARSTSSNVNIATQISTTGGSAGGGSSSNPVGAAVAGGTGTSGSGGTGTGGTGSNNSTTSVSNRSDNNFWYSLEKNIRDMLRASTLNDVTQDPLAQMAQQQAQAQAPTQQQQGGAALPMGAGSPFPAADNTQLAVAPAPVQRSRVRYDPSIVVNAETGLIAVRATARQHEKIQEFLDLVLNSAKRQVLIEATIIEVKLGDQYQQGINWSRIGSRLNFSQGQVGTAPLPSGVLPNTSPGAFILNYVNPGNLTATIQLLESFGKVKVLSSPKISVLNNQTAMLKVVDNNVFFTIKVTPAVLNANGTVTAPATYESKLETVPVGFVMSVTPQIAESDEVTLNVRPTITRIVGYVQDPNPALAAEKVISRVPVIQARELESIMKVSSGQVAVMGGLMQDSVDNAKDGLPLFSSLPVIGNLFAYRNENAVKTELVIFMRPVVVKDASVHGDYKDYRYLLPGQQAAVDAPYSEPAPLSRPGAL
ncbi:pilus (MSHA type) biogenesis protein MshL [Pseudoduganella namucuonensis]|uniref:Type IV pilus biogenesis and competence protein PilQ n=1 Tax=Pseudoduganella namucuonensis TaxID=1035707 RepID=A0A1I7L601_9BURK|nr:pilus (MSHA type) biogenesis protein MshL [Pseudoduganella namucuonensis]SFV05121.1 general secretion pathway protein D [Pseudoduganella namucuonensis]